MHGGVTFHVAATLHVAGVQVGDRFLVVPASALLSEESPMKRIISWVYMLFLIRFTTNISHQMTG